MILETMDIDLATCTGKHGLGPEHWYWKPWKRTWPLVLEHGHGPDHLYWKTWAWTWPLVLENIDLATGSGKHGHGPDHWFCKTWTWI
jgi:hypothetical protein